MRMNNVEPPPVVLRSENVMNEGAAHVVDFFDKVCMQSERATMVVNAVYAVIGGLMASHAREDVNFMAFSLQGGCQFSNMNSHTSYSDGVEGFPG